MSEQLMLALAEQDVPQGYKKTEVGVIPEDWDLLTIDDVATFSGGAQPPRSTFISSPKAGYIRLIQIRDYKTSQYETYIPEPFARKKCSSTEIMIGRYGPPIFQILRGITGAYNVALIKATPKSNIQQEYLYYTLKSEKLFDLMEMLSQRSSGQTGVELPALRAYPLPLPPLKEQTAIATALSDVDALITELEKLIAKKQAIKTATMQQLLTGRTRLPQFALRDDGTSKGYKASELGEIPEDWEISFLQNAVEFLDGLRRPVKSSERSKVSGTYPYYGASGIVDYVDDYIFDDDLILLGEDGENILSRNLPLAFQVSGKIWVNNHAHVMKPKTDFHITYLTSFLESLDYSLLNSGTAQPKLNKRSCLKIRVFKPSLDEQTAIATILSNMDSDIDRLQQQLNKTRQIKQGMMQELLTGKTRLKV